MTLAMLIRTFFEFAAIILLIIGLINEKKVIDFENRLFKAIRLRIGRYLRRKLGVGSAPASSRVDGGTERSAAGTAVIVAEKSASRVA